jgi:hypothetical protein
MREDTTGNAQPLDRAWTIQTDGIRVPAPMREDTTGNAQPLDRAWTIQTDRIRVPAPRLELQSGSLNDLRSIVYDLASNSDSSISHY